MEMVRLSMFPASRLCGLFCHLALLLGLNPHSRRAGRGRVASRSKSRVGVRGGRSESSRRRTRWQVQNAPVKNLHLRTNPPPVPLLPHGT